MKKSNLATALDDISDTAIQQREAVESKLRIALRGHPDSQLWGDAGLIAATMRCVDALDEAIEQRDEWKAKYIQQNLDLGCELMDPNGTIWDHANKLETELTAVTEQRDVALSDLEFRRDLYALQTKQLTDMTVQRDELAKQIEANHKGTLMLEQMVYDAREQRDRLAEAIITHRAKAFPLTGEDFDQELWQALQSLTPTQPEPK